MRPIKFRAWHKRMKKMCPVWKIKWSNKLEIWANLFGDFLESSEIVLMEFTGLKDALNNEIYDGDILGFKKYNDPNNMEIQYYYTVEWGTFGWKMAYAPIPVHLYPENAKNSVVIGNIYVDKRFYKKVKADYLKYQKQLGKEEHGTKIS